MPSLGLELAPVEGCAELDAMAAQLLSRDLQELAGSLPALVVEVERGAGTGGQQRRCEQRDQAERDDRRPLAVGTSVGT